MRRIILLTLAIVFCVSEIRGGDLRDLIGSVVWVENTAGSSSGSLNVGQIDVGLERGAGLAFGGNVYLTDRLSVEVRATLLSGDGSIRYRVGDSIATLETDLQTLPLTGILQYHFNTPGDIDPYIGAGAAYIFFNEQETLEFSEGAAGLVANAGFDIPLSSKWGLNFDAKYVPIRTSVEPTSRLGVSEDFEFEPVIISAGLIYRLESRPRK